MGKSDNTYIYILKHLKYFDTCYSVTLEYRALHDKTPTAVILVLFSMKITAYILRDRRMIQIDIQKFWSKQADNSTAQTINVYISKTNIQNTTYQTEDRAQRIPKHTGLN